MVLTAAASSCRAGTVVDTHICHPYEFDFFLNAHAGLQVRSPQGAARTSRSPLSLDCF